MSRAPQEVVEFANRFNALNAHMPPPLHPQRRTQARRRFKRTAATRAKARPRLALLEIDLERASAGGLIVAIGRMTDQHRNRWHVLAGFAPIEPDEIEERVLVLEPS